MPMMSIGVPVQELALRIDAECSDRVAAPATEIEADMESIRVSSPTANAAAFSGLVNINWTLSSSSPSRHPPWRIQDSVTCNHFVDYLSTNRHACQVTRRRV